MQGHLNTLFWVGLFVDHDKIARPVSMSLWSNYSNYSSVPRPSNNWDSYGDSALWSFRPFINEIELIEQKCIDVCMRVELDALYEIFH